MIPKYFKCFITVDVILIEEYPLPCLLSVIAFYFNYSLSGQVNFSWLKEDCSALDVPKMDPDRFVPYLNAEIRVSISPVS